MSVSKVFVEIGEDKLPFRIIKNHAEVWKLPPEKVAQWPKSAAVSEIRKKVAARADGHCELCGNTILWDSGHMHEKIFRSQGGEVSVQNSIFICPKCHRKEHKV